MRTRLPRFNRRENLTGFTVDQIRPAALPGSHPGRPASPPLQPPPRANGWSFIKKLTSPSSSSEIVSFGAATLSVTASTFSTMSEKCRSMPEFSCIKPMRPATRSVSFAMNCLSGGWALGPSLLPITSSVFVLLITSHRFIRTTFRLKAVNSTRTPPVHRTSSPGGRTHCVKPLESHEYIYVITA